MKKIDKIEKISEMRLLTLSMSIYIYIMYIIINIKKKPIKIANNCYEKFYVKKIETV